MKKNELFEKYPYIVAWGKKLGSFSYYIEKQCQEANNDRASRDAIYKNRDGVWVVVGDDTKLRSELQLYINGQKGGVLL